MVRLSYQQVHVVFVRMYVNDRLLYVNETNNKVSEG